jgi:hypothetical protein
MLGNLAKVFLQYDDIDSANEVMIKVNTLKNQLSSYFPEATLNTFIDKSIERQNTAIALVHNLFNFYESVLKVEIDKNFYLIWNIDGD